MICCVELCLLDQTSCFSEAPCYETLTGYLVSDISFICSVCEQLEMDFDHILEGSSVGQEAVD